MTSLRHGTFALALLTMPAAAQAQEDTPDSQSIKVSLGSTYSKGDYGGASSTRIFSAPLSLRFSKRRFSIRVTVPFVRIDGVGTLIDSPQGQGSGSVGDDDGGSGISGGESETEIDDGSGGGEDCPVTPPAPGVGEDKATDCPINARAMILAAAATPSGPRSGLGDISVTLGYGLDLGRFTTLDLAARIKVPTASRVKGLGTGMTDVTLGGTLAHDFGPVTLWSSARRRMVGKPVGLVLRDTWGAGGGISVRATSALTLGVDYDWQQSATGRRPFSELTGWVALPLTQRLRINAYAGTGLNARSAKFIGGLGLSWKLD